MGKIIKRSIGIGILATGAIAAYYEIIPLLNIYWFVNLVASVTLIVIYPIFIYAASAKKEAAKKALKDMKKSAENTNWIDWLIGIAGILLLAALGWYFVAALKSLAMIFAYILIGMIKDAD